MSNALAVLNGKFSGEEIEVVKNTVAKGATDVELAMFLSLAHKYQLDVFAKELYFIKMGGTPTIFTSRDGYLSIAHKSGVFDGMVSDVVYEGDIFKRHGVEVEHEYSSKRGKVLGAYALIYRTDKKVPTYAWAPWTDYNKGNGQWKTYPHAMILKTAEALALKRAFSISGLVTQEEIDVEPKRATEVIPSTSGKFQQPSQKINEGIPVQKANATREGEPIDQKTIGKPRKASDLERDVVDAEYVESITSTSELAVSGAVSLTQGELDSGAVSGDTTELAKGTPKGKYSPPIQDPRISVWGKYLKHYGDAEKAKVKIAELLDNKPSKDWDMEDMKILEGYLTAPEFGEKEEDFKGIAAEKPKKKGKVSERDTIKEQISKLFIDELGMTEGELAAWLERKYHADTVDKFDTGMLRKILKVGQDIQAARDNGEPDPE